MLKDETEKNIYQLKKNSSQSSWPAKSMTWVMKLN
jgi:hypothetical protein